MSRCELIKYLLRYNLFSEAHKQIPHDSNLPAIFYKYEGLILLNLNKEEEANLVLNKYLNYVEKQLKLKAKINKSYFLLSLNRQQILEICCLICR